jgi:acyl-CoA reductase-like NAD-dependent aldehyde dehydrogenase
MTVVATSSTIDVRNPATGELIGEVPVRSEEVVAELARLGRAAQPAWRALGVEGRSKIIGRLQRRLLADADRIVEVIVSESGKTADRASNMEIAYVAVALDFWRSWPVMR